MKNDLAIEENINKFIESVKAFSFMNSSIITENNQLLKIPFDAGMRI